MPYPGGEPADREQNGAALRLPQEQQEDKERTLRSPPLSPASVGLGVVVMK